MPLGDNLDPKDEILTRLSQAPRPEEMPLLMQCPAGHQVTRQVFEWVRTTSCEDGGDTLTDSGFTKQIPYWVCVDCMVVYRYQECRLLPGDEGRP